MSDIESVVILSACRTAVGTIWRQPEKSFRPIIWAALVIGEAANRANVEASDIQSAPLLVTFFEQNQMMPIYREFARSMPAWRKSPMLSQSIDFADPDLRLL